ncbi:MAG: TIGR02646 family protein [Microcoleus vaginatus WJT46-NPBG5]|jgi:uncharacterized protein (TIGR02646 family)|nr:TIGR02646 family protein [Microcoleus vaginatus WJT46-NPBG5]
MRYIQKGEEPECLAKWKAEWKALENEEGFLYKKYKNFQNPEKAELHDCLLREQGYICCYCGIGIDRNNSHIEHLKPQSNYPNLDLEYTNLLASCQRESEKFDPTHCGPKKKNEELMVSPLQVNCGDFFSYVVGSGEILPATDPDKQAAAKETIDKLGLDIDKLRAARVKALEAFLNTMQDEELSDEEKRKFAKNYHKINKPGGKYGPFSAFIADICKKFYPQYYL